MASNIEICVGYHSVHEILTRGVAGGELYCTELADRNGQLRRLAKRRGIGMRIVTASELRRIAGPRARQVALIISGAGSFIREEIGMEDALEALQSDRALALLLSGVTDVGNAGAILRSADLFDVDIVALLRRHTVGETKALMHASAGAAAHIRLVRIANVARGIDRLREAGFWIYGADSAGAPIADFDLSGRVAFLLGDEAKGLGRLVRERCDRLIAIPTRGHIDSLNVSVAAAILMYETRRQQRYFE